MMVTPKLVAYCLFLSGAYLIVVTFFWHFLGKYLRMERDMPPPLLEPFTPVWHVVNFAIEFLVFVAIPTLAFAMFAVILPLTGTRIGLAVALAAFTLGAMPAIVGLSVRTRLPVVYLLFYLLGLLVKLAGSLAIIGHLYAL